MEKNNLITQIRALKKDLLNSDWQINLKAADALVKIGGKKVLNVVMPLLKNRKLQVRSAAALALSEIRDNRATKRLIEASLKNPSNNAALVYALETHDCSDFFFPIFKIALYHKYMAQLHALQILREQKFKTSIKEIDKARQLMDEYERRKNKCRHYKMLLKKLERYLSKIQRYTNHKSNGHTNTNTTGVKS